MKTMSKWWRYCLSRKDSVFEEIQRCGIWGAHSSEYEAFCILGFENVKCGHVPTAVHSAFDLEDGNGTFLRNLSNDLPDYMA
jgi:hypothetical protein